jgi:hypothetical protein
MPLPPFAAWTLEQEARSLLTRLARLRPFALQESMLPAANLSPSALLAVEELLANGRRVLEGRLNGFIDWLSSSEGRAASAEEAQRRFTLLRLRFNAVLTHFDLFSDIVTQRSENETGVWLSGLDVLSADALRLREPYFEEPPILCYLDRGMGAAIRRARTRIPGGGENPVAIVRVPRERMVGSGIASSLFHEVGHQAAALLGLVESLRPELRAEAERDAETAPAFRLWKRWISEIVADFWSIARVGVASTMGLMGVVSLPRAFVFRINEDDPHPVPWIRVKLSAAIGNALFPQPVWSELGKLWESYYPRNGLDAPRLRTLELLERTLPRLVQLLIRHRPSILRGRSLVEALDIRQLAPLRLRRLLGTWRQAPQKMYETRPIVVLAAIGQGRADGELSPEEESAVIGKLLTHWALHSTLQAAAEQRGPRLSTTTRRTSWKIQ